MNVLSLCDGMSCAQIALDKVGAQVNNYYASEIDKPAITVTQANFPNTKHLGDLLNWGQWNIDFSSIDLVAAGTPCQGLSFAGLGGAFEDPRSKLFFTAVDILIHIKLLNPNVEFLFENVKMPTESLDIFSDHLGVQPVFINSALVSAQNRKRYYWASWVFGQPKDKGILLKDILEEICDCPIGYRVREKSKCVRVGGRNMPYGTKQEWDKPFQRMTKRGKVKPGIDKAACLTGGAHSGGNHSDMDIIHSPAGTRRYSVLECERLQGVPDGYTDHVSNTQRYKMLGNGWNVDTIVSILEQGDFKS